MFNKNKEVFIVLLVNDDGWENYYESISKTFSTREKAEKWIEQNAPAIERRRIRGNLRYYRIQPMVVE